MGNYYFKMMEDLLENYQLPDPFIGPDGKRISSPDEWPSQRDYLLNMLDFYLYGSMPPNPSEVRGEIVKRELRYGGAAIYETVRLHCDDLIFCVTIVRPNKTGRFPAICFSSLLFINSTSPVEWEAVCERGYVLVTFDACEIAPDRPEGGGPLYDAYPEWKGKSMMAWTWGTMRVNDYLLSCDYIDPEKLVVTGCSRLGKQALCAAIHDTRISLAGVAGSGCCGGGCLRILGDRYGMSQDSTKIETLGSLLHTFPNWFSENMRPFASNQPPYALKNEFKLPFDMHFARALVAPRPMIITNALADDWGNLYGDYVNWLASQEVYEFLGAGDKNAFFYRKGQHGFGREEWIAIMDFADLQFFGKRSPSLARINKPIFGNIRHFDWERPYKI